MRGEGKDQMLAFHDCDDSELTLCKSTVELRECSSIEAVLQAHRSLSSLRVSCQLSGYVFVVGRGVFVISADQRVLT